jgi:hypothetical protein|tara:strand:+ start:222 stop:362 length:141 start_codon:yes stop_codon:yes gene_type:complete
MKKIISFLVIMLIVAIGGGLAFVATWEIPVPSQKVEKVLNNEKFPR